MNKYEPTIGLEIHAELRTNTKLFCDSKNDSEEKRPNVNVCPICMGHPGTLPVLNKQAVKHVLMVGCALGGNLAEEFTEFDRKNYFYPDIPKGYQISQYKYPLVSGGTLNGIAVTRVHLEEDTARSTHHEGENYSLIDFNRAGVSLMELVTEPVITSAEEAGKFARELQLVLRYLGVSDANMEKGEMRVEANISISKDYKMGTKIEVKNLNSFRSVERAILYEIKRQSDLLEKGGTVVQETRGWNEVKQETYPQRLKEGSADYRYFPEPDLPKLRISEIPEFKKEALLSEMPELPEEKRSRYREIYGLKDEDTEIFIRSDVKRDLLESAFEQSGGDKEIIQSVANYVIVEIPTIFSKTEEVTEEGLYKKYRPEDLVELAKMKHAGEISSRGVKDVLAEMFLVGGSSRDIASQLGILQRSDENEVRQIAETIISENRSVAEEYRSGKKAALQFLMGQGMVRSKGSANPEILRKILIKKLQG